MPKTILFLLIEPFADWEAAYLSSALHMLAPGRYETKTVAHSGAPVRSMGGFRILPDYDIQSAPKDYDALILIGGMSWRTQAARAVIPFVRQCADSGRVLGAICDATVFLGGIGLLNQLRHTSNDRADLMQWAGSAYTGNARYVREQAVRDGNLVTANGTAALEFAREVLLALEAAPVEKILAWYDFHKRGYYEAPMPQM